MMCFLCKRVFENIEKFWKHLRLFHCLTEKSDYRCVNPKCFQNFKSFRAYKKHFKSCVKPFEEMQNISDPHPGLLNNSVHVPNSLEMNISLQSDDQRGNKSPLSPVTLKNSIFNVDDEISDIHRSAVMFLLQAHSRNNMNRQDVNRIMSESKNFLIEPIIRIIFSFFESKKLLDPDVNILLESLNDPFILCNSEYKLINWLKKNDYLAELHVFTLSNEINQQHRSGEAIFTETRNVGVVLPIQFQIRKNFEIPNALKNTLERIETYEKNINKGCISNFVQGDYWQKKKQLFPGKIVIPFFIYGDEYEVNNALGSHSSVQSITAFYISFPVYETFSPRKRDIFSVAYIKSNDFKTYGNGICLCQLVKIITELEQEGIEITINSMKIKVYFVLGLVIGDNQAVNGFLDFVKSFNATFYCRICRTPKHINQEQSLDESEIDYRNVDNYNNDLLKQDFSQTGIKKNSILNNIPSFHVTENPYADLMHDLFEGVLHYDFCHVIQNFISRNIFSLEQLNLRKQLFNYGPIEIENLSEEIKMEHIRSMKLRMSAREMLTFCHFFCLMFGDLVDAEDEIWKFVCLISEIVELLLSHTFTPESIKYLGILIKEHNKKYVEFFTDTLKPKHHFMTHYAYIIKKSGPLQQLYCFLYELRNRDGKVYAHSMNSRVNTPLSLAKKSQLQFVYNIMTRDSDNVECDTNHQVVNSIHTSIICITTGLNMDEFISFEKVIYFGKIYKKGYYLSCYGEIPKLCKILEIIVENVSRKMRIIGTSIYLNDFSSHYQAYRINSQFSDNIEIFDMKHFSGPPINICTIVSGDRFIKLKDYY